VIAAVHELGHSHDHGLEGYHVHGGSPALDIGGDIGALVVTMDPSALGTELHLRSEHEPPIAVHTGVWERQQAGQTVVAAVFAELVQGRYRVVGLSGATDQLIEIEGGKVTTIDLRT
jgi:hypothetical protein